MNILILEDESRVLQYLQDSLRAAGYVIYGCPDIEEAKAQIEVLSNDLDLAILDRMIERQDAITLIPHVRKHCKKARVLVLSTLNTPEQKARALDAGADDYLGKPFSLVELEARIRSLLRRQASSTERTKLELRNVELNLLEHRLIVNGKNIDLSGKEFKLLQLFMEHPGRVYNKFQLLDRVWDVQFDIESNVVEVTIKNLRRRLEDCEAQIEILSKRNIGYWIEA